MGSDFGPGSMFPGGSLKAGRKKSGPKIATRGPQDAPKTLPRRLKTDQDAPKTAQDAPKTAQDAPQDGPQTVQNASRDTPGSPKMPRGNALRTHHFKTLT